MIYPSVLKIEITNYCNAACVFCNNSKITDRQNMPLWMVRKIIDSFPEAKQVQPQWFGEPLMHPEFEEIINICKQAKKQVVFYTNASLIHKKYEALKKLGKNDKVIISLEGADKQTYESIRKGLSWERLLKNIELLQGLSARKVIRMTICEEIRNDLNKVVSFWKKKTGWKVLTVSEKPLGRKLKGSFIQNSCKRPWAHFTISVKGYLKLCCVDYNNQVDLGIIHELVNLRNLWKATEKHRNCSYDICKQCLFEWKE